MSPKTKVLEQPIEILTLAQQIGALHLEIESHEKCLTVRYDQMLALLTQAKAAAGHGGWLKWLADNEKTLGFGERQAQRYLREPTHRESDLERHAEGARKRRAATKASKEAGTELSPVPPNLHVQDEVDPEEETTEPLVPLLKVVKGTELATKVLEEHRATKSDEHGVAYYDNLGRRRPKRPLSDRMERISWEMEAGIEALGRVCIDARRKGYQGFPALIQRATTWRSMLDAVLDLVQQESCPTETDLEAILNPPDDGDPEPAS